LTKFARKKKFTLLGIDIDDDLVGLNGNFQKTCEKMQRIVNFWERFNLSFAGRIRIAKCFLLSQVNYFGGICMPDPDTIRWMQNLMDNFCTGKLRLSKEKLYAQPEDGGGGLINITDTLTAQQAVWFKRAYISTRDNWRLKLWECGSGNCLAPDPDMLSKTANPILYNLTASFRKFAQNFYLKDNNIFSSYILNNPCITPELGFPYAVNTKFWTANPANIYTISKLKICDFIANGKFKPFVQLNLDTGANLSFVTYLRLSGIIKRVLGMVKPNKKNISIETFLLGFKKGSKKIRKLLTGTADELLNKVWQPFSEIAGIPVPVPVLVPVNFPFTLSLWNLNCLPNNFKDFLFKFFHNRLGLNARTANFVDQTKWCTFCTLVGKGLGPFNDETFKHFFLECPTTQKIHNDIGSNLLENIALSKDLWLGLTVDNKFLNVFTLSVQFILWEHKLNNKLPTVNFCLGEAVYLADVAVRLNSKIRNDLSKLDCSLSRLWSRLTRPRW
jgi:hypothetical protein